MSVKSIIHIGFDMTLIAMLLAAIRRDTGLILKYEKFDFSTVIYGYLNWGEHWYTKLVNYCKKSPKFRKLSPTDRFIDDDNTTTIGRIEELD
ncbi:Mco12p NDAI_0C00220 [Naumovozyma dairenensis CBS 421]|uniref:DUF1748-domain-containing protein n=1 Tax=Naumovozyma dairenensis (strain ATCC 10597 / BCRC 20456 / CBS 421 / NBRC 0211 / NRRL Y-12639) TaxID=1071378 RepID=G0W7C2_NAUDC|nr:hypothetical protein NDAI_0C00220 [Naumovozyma dairenensis CBS 421]CCD23683.1 hypothetical protein NDAI_0C00220 [Naumovozyma dairenensis CBS 421]